MFASIEYLAQCENNILVMHVSVLNHTLAVLAVVCALIFPAAAQAAEIGDAERLVRKFEDAISQASSWPRSLRREERQVVRKWRGSLGVAFISDTKPRNIHAGIQQHMIKIIYETLPLMGRYMGVPMRHLLAFEKKNADIDVWFGNQDKMTRWLAQTRYGKDVAARAIRNTACGIDIREIDQSVVPITVFIRDDANEHVAPHCILAGILVVLGLPGYLAEPQISLEKAPGDRLTRLTNELRILLRTLYDPRITDGMSVKDAVAQARVIIPELLAIVKGDDFSPLLQIETRPAQDVR